MAGAPPGDAEDRVALDAAAVRRIVRGDAAGLEGLSERYGRIVYSFAYRITRDAGLAEPGHQPRARRS